jgi:nucleoside-diphosphate-sugar epimerase
MKVVITGGAGFIGTRLARQLLDRETLTGPDGEPRKIDQLVLFDIAAPAALPSADGVDITAVTGQISDRGAIEALIDRDDISVFHLASVVSGGGEKDFDLAMRVNLDGSRYLLEALRARSGQPRLVFASSIAVYGGDAMPDVVSDATKQTAQTTYGVTKTITELLINDYSRKGFLNGRSARLPTVIIRPGKPNAAASSFVSGVFREPLNGIDFVLPVPMQTVMPLLGYRAIIDGFVHLHEIDAEALGDDRAVGLPSLTVTAGDMVDALKRVAGERALGAIRVDVDPFIVDICKGWAQDCDDTRALRLGLPVDASLDEIVRYYIADYLDG